MEDDLQHALQSESSNNNRFWLFILYLDNYLYLVNFLYC